ncbi:helix-turn-helix domain-containing protein [Nocardia jiangxiensis]|uniref:Helix-turn-helix domain-containing protein n=1 Tax=Nocardia jiangxiensis TaxID=282685 RepID=A0ABW6RYX6_9NOCA
MLDPVRRSLGRHLRALRIAAGMSQSAAGTAVFLSPQSIGRIEDGQYTRVSNLHINALCDLYGVTGDGREVLLGLVQQAREARRSARPDWWSPFTDLLSADELDRLVLEQHAIAGTAFGSTLIPGLAHTADYRCAFEQILHPQDSPTDIARRVELAEQRSKRLHTNNFRVSIYILESALWHVIGGPGVMHTQLAHLAEISARPTVSVRVIGREVNSHIGFHLASFVLLEFGVLLAGDPPEPPEVFIDGAPRSLRLQREGDIGHYRAATDELSRIALSESASRTLLHQITQDYRA